MRFPLVSCIILLLQINLAFSQQYKLKVQNLSCEYLTNPIAIENLQPKLSWQLKSKAKAIDQKTYSILVASSPALLEQNKGDYWRSGKVNSGNSTHIVYQGKALNSRVKLYWKVKVWDEQGKSSDWSPVNEWSMGLLQPADWKGKWIGAFKDPYPDSAITYPSPFFRKEFMLTKAVRKATVHISGLGFYELQLNGKKVGDQVLAPAVANYDQRPLRHLLYPYDDQSTQRVLYNTFDVKSYLNTTNNAIGIQLGNGWYNQRDRRVEGDMWYDVPKLIFQLELIYTDGSTKIISSDASWKTSSGPLLHDGIFTGEKYDARLAFGNWAQTGYKDSQWKPAILVRAPSGKLHSQTAPFDKVTRTLKPTFGGKVKDSVYLYHLDETVAGWASIAIKGKAGSRLKIRYISEEGEDYGQYDTYILKGGALEHWEPKFTWHAFRKLEVISTDISLNQENLVVKDVHTEVASQGSFECSNPFFNQINAAYLRTQRANFHGSVSSDCPHRERLGYTGDGQTNMESALYSFDMTQFYQKWLKDIDNARNRNTGFVTHTAPFGGGGGGPAWGSAYVIMPWLYYSYYGDRSILEQHYIGMKQWAEYLGTRLDEKGLVSKEEPKGWCLGDWCTPTQIQIPETLVNTAYFYYVTDIMAKVAKSIGKTDDCQTFVNVGKKIKADFNRAYYNSAKSSYWEGRQGADVFALAFGLTSDKNYNPVFNSLLEHLKATNYHFDTGILGTPLLLKVLAQNGRHDIIYKIMNQKDFPSFGYLLDSKNSTLWETWNGDGSKSHPMFGSVIKWFYSGIAGIKVDPSSPGMQHFIIAPQNLADLTYCRSSYNNLYGKIRSEWKRNEPGKFQILIEIPENSSATFVLPKGKQKIINNSGQPYAVNKKGNAYQAEFKSGIYEFEML
ncbi:family 78 glycoside hydrolase catalytic domain [Pedobacter sp. JCM 36344]|uniref:family 78 glycoside hydrolase catalytic domain n=1 Tax=Pedobacter sp. JCM 36344 TaxID=3374280 RepID=UPI00397B367E